MAKAPHINLTGRHVSIPFPHLIHAAETPQSSLAASSATIARLDFLLNLVLQMELQFFGKVVSTRPLRNKAFRRESKLAVNVTALFTHHSSLVTASFIPQGHDRIDFRCAASWEIASQQSDGAQGKRCPN